MLSDEGISTLVRQVIDAWCKNDESAAATIWYPVFAKPMAEAIRTAVAEAVAIEQEACCKALCFLCAEGLSVQFKVGEVDMPWLGWWHPDAPNEIGPACRAAVIRAARSQNDF